jgi:hypothetical protein
MLFEALLDNRQDFLVHQPCHGILHHALFFSQRAANVEQIYGIQIGHVVLPLSIESCAIVSSGFALKVRAAS